MPNGNPELHIFRTVLSVAFLGLVKMTKVRYLLVTQLSFRVVFANYNNSEDTNNTSCILADNSVEVSQTGDMNILDLQVDTEFPCEYCMPTHIKTFKYVSEINETNILSLGHKREWDTKRWRKMHDVALTNCTQHQILLGWTNHGGLT